jgi:hypothetical protein
VIALALAAALLVWLLFIRDSGSDQTAQRAEKTVRVVSADQLLTAFAGVGHPVYWVGKHEGVRYEVTRISDGRSYVRYLPAGAEAGSGRPFLTVGSYSVPNAYERIRRLAERPGESSFAVPGNGIALPNGNDPRSVYLAYPGVDVQIEVYDPAAGRALQLVKSVTPIG